MSYLQVIQKYREMMREAARRGQYNWQDKFFIGNNADGTLAWAYGSPGIMTHVRETSPGEVVTEFSHHWQSPEAVAARLGCAH